MAKFLIANAESDQIYGIYEGDSRGDALDTWARDAGYASAAELPTEIGELQATPASEEDAVKHGFVAKQAD